MRASVIIPTFQRPAFLIDALVSVCTQDFPRGEFEILAVDNAPQATPELAVMCASETLPQVRYIHEPHNGLHNARHAGARAARGEILVYIDDDVICPMGWLAAMLAPYDNPVVAMVAGKVVLRYEIAPPAWLEQFRGILSALDWGNTSHAVSPYISPVGCNMSIRKSALFEVGGFNPDGFGNRSLMHLRGDGECGLARKIHDKGWIVWYTPDAWLEHRIPANRHTQSYIKYRSAIGGIEEAYTDLRYHETTVSGLIVRNIRHAICYVYHSLQSYRFRSNFTRRMHHLAVAKRYQFQVIQRWKQATTLEIRKHTTRSNYL